MVDEATLRRRRSGSGPGRGREDGRGPADSEKPLHPRGTVWSGALVRQGGSSSGVHWLDEPGTTTP